MTTGERIKERVAWGLPGVSGGESGDGDTLKDIRVKELLWSLKGDIKKCEGLYGEYSAEQLRISQMVAERELSRVLDVTELHDLAELLQLLEKTPRVAVTEPA